MADVHTPKQRSFNMSRIKSRNTKPELVVRSLIHKMGYRYRLHRKDLPGSPDLVFSSRKKVIFVHGCFFHLHDCRYGRVVPKTNADFWQEKRSGNAERDKRNLSQLTSEGWKTMVVWECEVKNKDKESLLQRLKNFLDC